MDMICLEGKTNFFEKRVGEYQKSGVMASLPQEAARTQHQRQLEGKREAEANEIPTASSMQTTTASTPASTTTRSSFNLDVDF